jgi:agmatinase
MSKKEPWRELNNDNIDLADVIIMGVPFDENVSCGRGTAKAPSKMRDLSAYLPPVTEEGNILLGTHICDLGDVEKHPHENVIHFFSRISQKAMDIFELRKFPIFIGGDHSISIPLRKAFAQHNLGKKIGLIHFDAHADICDIYDGNKLSHASVSARSIEDGFFPESIIAIGIRSFEIQELEYYRKHPEMRVITAHEIFDKNVDFAVGEILKTLDHSYQAVYMSVDIDCLDPAYAPGTGTPEAGGLTSRFLLEMIKKLCKSLPIRAMDIVEVSPPNDVNDITSWAALKLILEVVAYAKKNKEN